MDFERIKNMNKREFEQFIFGIQKSKQNFCIRCGNFTMDRIRISVSKDSSNPKKLCNVCKDCYSDILDYLAISDVD